MTEKHKNKKWLKFKSTLRYFLNCKSKKVKIGDNYELKFYENFNNIEKWFLAYKWGWFHPKRLYKYCDREFGDCVNIVNQQLVLKTKYDPITVIKSELPEWQQSEDLPAVFTIPYKIGLIETNETWKYGWFVSDIKLPKGKQLWSSFWLTGADSWPPEIDILEAYSDEKDLSKKTFKNWKIQPNVHYGVINTDSMKSYGSYSCHVKNSTDKLIEYALHWEKDFMRIYYGGYKIMEITDKSILEWFNCNDCNMRIILNNGVDSSHNGTDESTMIVDNFKVYQKK